jgi:hypothetical protein
MGAKYFGPMESLFPPRWPKSFKDVFDKLSEAQVERRMEFQHARSAGYEKSFAVLDTGGGGMLANLESLVRTTMRRD